jgi:hypothetical protein
MRGMARQGARWGLLTWSRAPAGIDRPQSVLRGTRRCVLDDERATTSEREQENSMLDLAMLALGLGFFAAAVGYTYACERL